MKPKTKLVRAVLLIAASTMLSACVTTRQSGMDGNESSSYPADYSSRLPQHINTSENTIVVDPSVHAWGAYNANGDLVKAGLASAGSSWCRDLGSPCRTHVGTFRIHSLGSPTCVSHTFPLGRGGSPMPYCMFFNSGQALHGVPPSEIGEGNYSHGCVRLQVGDAEWLRYEFAGIGTKVIVRPY
ncbi:MAG TPA: L,D-transpeptidase [Gammaproteobacteria bacterium]|jgi:hypothetical protein|nr:L,D-transpeptidase [Gammaproteobacteria bacterium]